MFSQFPPATPRSMQQQLTNRLKYAIERLLLRGAQYRLLVVAAGIGLISLAGGVAVVLIGTDMPLDTAIWWAFLRLSDPGYLGDDHGAGVRVVSTILTVAGYVVFLGALVAILTQWLNATMTALESGLTPIAQQDHILILGWTNRTPAIVRELLLSEGRVRRFLRQHGARGLRIAILAERVTSELRRDLQERLGPLWRNGRIVFRSGTPLRLEHLQRVDFTNAAAIVLPAGDFVRGGAAQADTRTIKTLLSITNQLPARELPLAVAEIFDARKIPVARRAYGGSVEILASDAIISRLIAQNVRHAGLSHVYGELLTHGRGSEIYIRSAEQLAGATVGAAQAAFPRAIVLGIVRPAADGFETVLALAGETIAAEDRIVLVARRYDDTEAESFDAVEWQPPVGSVTAEPAHTERRVLVLGWSHKTPALLREFDEYALEQFRVDVVSRVPAAERERAIARYGDPLSRIVCDQIEADYTAPSDLERIRPGGYHNIVLLASDWLESGEESDARTILGYLLLREQFGADERPELLVELLDPANVSLFRRRPGEVLISPVLLSHMLAQVALRRELRAVFDELFGPGGAELHFRPLARFGLAPGEYTFADVMREVAARGEVALGLRTGAPASEPQGGAKLNPARDRQFALGPSDEIITLAH